MVTTPAPALDPNQRDPGEVVPAGEYRPDDPVWVHRDGAWRAGVVEAASNIAIMVTYRRTDGRGTGVDTMTAQYVVSRNVADPDLDGRGASRTRATDRRGGAS